MNYLCYEKINPRVASIPPPHFVIPANDGV